MIIRFCLPVGDVWMLTIHQQDKVRAESLVSLWGSDVSVCQTKDYEVKPGTDRFHTAQVPTSRKTKDQIL